MFNKIYNFIKEYGILIFLIISLFIVIVGILFIVIVGIIWFGSYIDKINNRDLDIINKTKNYTIFSSCKKISDKYYCWEDE